ARLSDIQPHTAMAPTRRTVRSGARAEPAMTRPIREARSGSVPGMAGLRLAVLVRSAGGRADAALGSAQEGGRGDDGLALRQAGGDLEVVGVARPQRHLLRPQAILAEVDEDQPPGPGVDHRVDRDLDARPEIDH